MLDRLELPLEDWIDTDDPELMETAAALFERLEEQLADKEIPAPPAEPVDVGCAHRCGGGEGCQGRTEAANGKALTART